MSVPDDDNARSAILRTFVAFREELDDYNDRRERLIKVCPPSHHYPRLI